MEGLQTLWIAWTIWLFVTFFSEAKHAKFISVVLLLIIALFPYTFLIGDVYINGAFIVCLLFASYLLIGESPLRKGYYFILSVTVTCAAVAFQLFEIFDPISIILNRILMLAVIIVALVLALPICRELRLPILLMGLVQAEFIYKDILAHLASERILGDAAFFDVLSLSILLLLLWQAFETFTLRMSETITQTNQSTVKSSIGEY